jgi:hypothetical protein
MDTHAMAGKSETFNPALLPPDACVTSPLTGKLRKEKLVTLGAKSTRGSGSAARTKAADSAQYTSRARAAALRDAIEVAVSGEADVGCSDSDSAWAEWLAV